MMSNECIHCGLTLRRAIFFAMAQDGGAQTSVDPLKCRSINGEWMDHDFRSPTKSRSIDGAASDQKRSGT